jgi:hypothetical protein
MCAEIHTWNLLVDIIPESINALVSNFVPSSTTATDGKVAEPSFLKSVVHLLYDEDPYVQRYYPQSRPTFLSIGFKCLLNW